MLPLRTVKERLSVLDIRLTAWFRRFASTPLSFRCAALLAQSGDSWTVCGLLLIGWIFSRGAAQRNFAYLGLSTAVTALFVLGLKALIGRSRPMGSWGAVYRRFDPYAFPSGHAVRGGLIAALASGFLPGWAAALIWIWALLMILSRVVMGVHYISDVLAGFALGLALGFGLASVSASVFGAYPIVFDRGLWLPALTGAGL